MKTRLFLLLCLAALATAANAQESDSRERNALALVDVTHIHDISAFGFLRGFVNKSKGRLPQSTIDCASGLDFGFLRPSFAAAIKATMSATEVETALAFYQSRPGKLYIAHQLQPNRGQFAGFPALEAAATAGEPTAEEFGQIKEFVLSPLGQEIDHWSDSPEFIAAQSEMGPAVVKQCTPKP